MSKKNRREYSRSRSRRVRDVAVLAPRSEQPVVDQQLVDALDGHAATGQAHQRGAVGEDGDASVEGVDKLLVSPATTLSRKPHV